MFDEDDGGCDVQADCIGDGLSIENGQKFRNTDMTMVAPEKALSYLSVGWCVDIEGKGLVIKFMLLY